MTIGTLQQSSAAANPPRAEELPPPATAHIPQTIEPALRRHLGIPDDARQVLIFGESSHWDPNWLRTSDEYYRQYVEPNLDAALDELAREPRRIYALECVFFLRLYWDRRPDRREEVRALVNEGRLRLTSSGVTTADTLLPRPEAILRDLLLGQEWLRRHGMTQEPRLAYFADSFGCSPALPSLLRAAGFDWTAITRIDGMYFTGADYQPPRRFPRPGSSAELLLRQEKTLDFVWRAPDGAQVLTHWNAYTYFQGDLLAHLGLARSYLYPFARPVRRERHIARRVARYVAQLAPFSRTPYLFCPIGMDFVAPIPGLVALLDRYNQVRYPTTGTWAVNAGLDDYLALVDCHRAALPVLELDPNPYWTGFYTSRPTLKDRCHDLVECLLHAEHLALLPHNHGAAQRVNDDLHEAWWAAATANHHDFITGTSTDRIVKEEQQPWLDEAMAAARAAMSRLKPAPVPGTPPVPQSSGLRERDGRHGHARTTTHPLPPAGALPDWHRRNGSVEIHTPYYYVELLEEAGGAIVHAADGDGRQILAGLANDLVCYHDRGGLWRMGHELWGKTMREIGRASRQRAQIDVVEQDGGLEIVCETEFDGLPVLRRLAFRADSPLIHLRVEGRAADRRTLSVQFETTMAPHALVMDQPGGVVERPLEKVYAPTYWPVQRFLHTRDSAAGHGVALCVRRPSAAAWRDRGRLELVAVRNARQERLFGFVPPAASPPWGDGRLPHAFDYALLFTPGGNWRDNDLDVISHGLGATPWHEDACSWHASNYQGLVTTDRHDIVVTAVKAASRGEGLIARLYTLTTPPPGVTLTLTHGEVEHAALCDARERDLAPLDVHAGRVHLSMPGALATVRLHLKTKSEKGSL
ncbi:MAG: hypothetical protein JXA93_07935 [Anaerolineae bacterium]|nr:hypothetical protein [Anaerolineae bacterium]